MVARKPVNIFTPQWMGLLKCMIKHRLGIEKSPYLCTFLPTLRCNLHCHCCDIWSLKDIGYELSVDEIKYIFNQISGLRIIKITGGEPFLRNDLDEILDYFLNQRQLLVQVTTNGLLTDRIIQTIRKVGSKRLHLCVSLDGVGSFVDKMRGLQGYYKKIFETLKSLAELKENRPFYLAVNQTVFYQDLSQIKKLRLVLEDIGIHNVHYIIQHNLFDQNATESEKKTYWSKVSHDNFEQAKKYIGKYTLDNVFRNAAYRYYFQGIENRILCGLKKPNFRCQALRSYFRLLPNGDIITCSVKNRPVANLRNQDFNKVWNNTTTSTARSEVDNCEGCWFACEVVPNATISGDILKGIFY